MSKPDTSPLESWSSLLHHESEVEDLLANIQEIGAKFIPSADLAMWNEQCEAIKLRSLTLHAQAVAVRFQLELRQKYGEQEADALTQSIAAKLPENATLADADKHVDEYCQAVKEYEEERESFGGAWDILKSLLLIPIKSPDERVRKKSANQG